MSHRSGRHFLQIPGPTNVPDRILRALAAPTIDHRGPELASLARAVLDGLKPIFGTTGPVVAFPSSGTGAWEAALVNTLSPGDRVLAFDTGHFAGLWAQMARALGLEMDYRHDEWRVDVTVSCSQKGLMLPPGLGFNALGERALAAAGGGGLGRSSWDWRAMLAANADGLFPYTPPTNLLDGLREALAMLSEEGLEHVFARHRRHAEATRLAVRAWGLEVLCQDPAGYSSSPTAVLVGDGDDADQVRRVALERYDLSPGAGLGRGGVEAALDHLRGG